MIKSEKHLGHSKSFTRPGKSLYALKRLADSEPRLSKERKAWKRRILENAGQAPLLNDDEHWVITLNYTPVGHVEVIWTPKHGLSEVNRLRRLQERVQRGIDAGRSRTSLVDVLALPEVEKRLTAWIGGLDAAAFKGWDAVQAAADETEVHVIRPHLRTFVPDNTARQKDAFVGRVEILISQTYYDAPNPIMSAVGGSVPARVRGYLDSAGQPHLTSAEIVGEGTAPCLPAHRHLEWSKDELVGDAVGACAKDAL